MEFSQSRSRFEIDRENRTFSPSRGRDPFGSMARVTKDSQPACCEGGEKERKNEREDEADKTLIARGVRRPRSLMFARSRAG